MRLYIKFLLRSDWTLAASGGICVKCINLDRIYRIIRIILFSYSYILSILRAVAKVFGEVWLILSEKLNIANSNKR